MSRASASLMPRSEEPFVSKRSGDASLTQSALLLNRRLQRGCLGVDCRGDAQHESQRGGVVEHLASDVRPRRRHSPTLTI